MTTIEQAQARLKDLDVLLGDYDSCFCDDDPEPILDGRDRCRHCELIGEKQLAADYITLTKAYEEEKARLDKLQELLIRNEDVNAFFFWVNRKMRTARTCLDDAIALDDARKQEVPK